jgi:hypothetical protein
VHAVLLASGRRLAQRWPRRRDRNKGETGAATLGVRTGPFLAPARTAQVAATALDCPDRPNVALLAAVRAYHVQLAAAGRGQARAIERAQAHSRPPTSRRAGSSRPQARVPAFAARPLASGRHNGASASETLPQSSL